MLVVVIIVVVVVVVVVVVTVLVLVSLPHAFFRLASFNRFTPATSLSRSLVVTLRPSMLPVPASTPSPLPIIIFLPPASSVSTPAIVSLQRRSSRRVFSLQPPRSPSSTVTLLDSTLSFSLVRSLCLRLPPTHTHPPPSSSAGSVRIGPARWGCCEIIATPHPSRNQPPRVTTHRGKQQ